MAAGSVLVLGALTATGIYVRNLSNQSFDEYIVDLTTLEDLSFAQNDPFQDRDNGLAIIEHLMPSDDLDYDPFYQETSSTNVSNPDSAVNLPNDIKEKIGGRDPGLLANSGAVLEGITSNDLEIGELVMAAEDRADELREETKEPPKETSGTRFAEPLYEKKEEKKEEQAAPSPSPASVPAISTSMQSALTFKEGDHLAWPVVGNVLINYSMDKSVYFPTLKQYKYNPAIIIQAQEGDIISAAASGRVTGIYEDTQLGNVITVDLGSGFEITYGQLKNILVSEGSFISAGDIIAEVAAPTKYFSVEGTNVYFKVTKDGVPVNPLSKLN
jgi:murein DD-endopeptidase MepM/ murein hydrolase activator NlpD